MLAGLPDLDLEGDLDLLSEEDLLLSEDLERDLWEEQQFKKSPLKVFQ